MTNILPLTKKVEDYNDLMNSLERMKEVGNTYTYTVTDEILEEYYNQTGQVLKLTHVLNSFILNLTSNEAITIFLASNRVNVSIILDFKKMKTNDFKQLYNMFGVLTLTLTYEEVGNGYVTSFWKLSTTKYRNLKGFEIETTSHNAEQVVLRIPNYLELIKPQWMNSTLQMPGASSGMISLTLKMGSSNRTLTDGTTIVGSNYTRQFKLKENRLEEPYVEVTTRQDRKRVAVFGIRAIKHFDKKDLLQASLRGTRQ